MVLFISRFRYPLPGLILILVITGYTSIAIAAPYAAISSVTVDEGQKGTVSLYLNNSTDTGSFDVSILFDPAVALMTGITGGSAVEYLATTTNNATGTARIGGYNLNNSINGSSVKLADLTVQAVAGHGNSTAFGIVINSIADGNATPITPGDVQNGSLSIADITPPASITFTGMTRGFTYINWTWNDPADPDFAGVWIWIDNVFKENLSKGIQNFNDTSFTENTMHTISTRTIDESGNMNQTWFNRTDRTNATVPSPMILSYTPSTAAVNDTAILLTRNATRTFSITLNEIVTINWTLDGALKKSETGATTSSSGILAAGAGTHSVIAIATNASTGLSNTTAWQWNISKGETVPPVISISAPVNSTLTRFDNAVTLYVSDDSPPISVNLYLNGNRINSTSRSGSGSFNLNVDYLLNQTNNLNAEAVDAWGNMNTSSTIAVFIQPDNITSSVSLSEGGSSSIIVPNQSGLDIAANATINGSITITAGSNISIMNASVEQANGTYGLGAGQESLDRYVEVNAANISPISLSYVNLSIYYSSGDLDKNGNGVRDAGDIDESSLEIYWWNGTIWKTLDTGANYSGEGGPVVMGIFRDDASAGYNTFTSPSKHKLKVKVNHFSIFSLIGSEISPSVQRAGAGSSTGGTGGGGVTTAEPYDNIEKEETRYNDLRYNIPVTYHYTAFNYGVYELAVTGKENIDEVSIRVENLKDLSRLLKEEAPGTVYHYTNIWADTPKIAGALVRFKVENTWLSGNNQESRDIRLLKWDGSVWTPLATVENSSDSTYAYFEASTDSFSQFAISGMTGEAQPAATPAETGTPSETAAVTVTPGITEMTPGKTQPGISVWGSGLILIAVYYFAIRRKRG